MSRAMRPTSGQARRLLLWRIGVVAGALFGWAAASAAFAQNRGPEPEEAPVFAPLQVRAFELTAQESLTIPLSLSEWKQVELLIETGAPEIAFSIQAPSGAKVLSLTPQQAGWMVASFAVTEPGAYRLIATAMPAPGSAITRPMLASALQFHVELLPVSSAQKERYSHGEILYANAEKLRNSEHEKDVRSAIADYREAARDWASADALGHNSDHELEILALAGEARSWLELSEYRSAVRALDLAVALSSRTEWLRAGVLSLHAQVRLDEWEGRAAEHYAKESLALAKELNDQWLMADAFEVRGEALYVRHAYSGDGKSLPGEKTAEDYIREALRLGGTSGASLIVARTLRCQSWLVEDRGEMTHAIALMQQAQEFFRNAGDARDAFDTLQDIIAMEAMRGESFSALDQLAELEPHTRESGNAANYGFLLLNMGNEYAQLNRDLDAIQSYEKAREVLGRIHHLSGAAASYGLLCAADVRVNDLNSALENCRESTVVDKRLDDPKRQGLSEYWFAKVLSAKGEVARALAAYNQALVDSAKVEDNHTEAQILIEWGDALESLHDQDEARALYEKALSFSVKAEESILQVEARFRIARWDATAGHTLEAIRQLKELLGQIESYRESVGNDSLQTSYFAAVRKCYQLYADILMRAPDRTPVSESLALEISDSSRARTLLDSLAVRKLAPTSEQAGGGAHDLIGLRLAVEQAYEQRLELMIEGGHSRELHANLVALTRATDALERAEDNSTKKSRDEAIEAAVGRPLNAEQILEASKSSPATLLEYSLGSERSYLWVVRKGTLKSYVLPPRKEIEDTIAQWRALTATRKEGAEDRARIAARLSCALLDGRIEEEAGSEAAPLVIVTDGSLAMVPFSALPKNGCGLTPGPPILTSHEVVKTPSLSIYLNHQRSQEPLEARMSFDGEVAIIADPVFDAQDDRVRVHLQAVPPRRQQGMDQPHSMMSARIASRSAPVLPRLFNTAAEADDILDAVGPVIGRQKATLWLGFDASMENVLSPKMREYRILHLATHGILDESSPGLSGLVLSLVSPDGSPVFGYLKARDIAGLDLHSELVVLSACDSWAGTNLSGEGVTGLPYAFFHAGVRRVVSTLWRVDDETSRDLMVGFYKEIFLNGRTPAEALRQSQINIMQSAHTADPYYWAGFEIAAIGN